MATPTTSSTEQGGVLSKPWYKQTLYRALMIAGIVIVVVGTSVGIYLAARSGKKGSKDPSNNNQPGRKPDEPTLDLSLKAATDFANAYEHLYKQDNQLHLDQDVGDLQKVLDAFAAFENNKPARVKLTLAAGSDEAKRYNLLLQLSKDPKKAAGLKTLWDTPPTDTVDAADHQLIAKFKRVIFDADNWLATHKVKASTKTLQPAPAGLVDFVAFVRSAGCVSDEECPVPEHIVKKEFHAFSVGGAALDEAALKAAVEKNLEARIVAVAKAILAVIGKVAAIVATGTCDTATYKDFLQCLEALAKPPTHFLEEQYVNDSKDGLLAKFGPQAQYDECKRQALAALMDVVNPGPGKALPAPTEDPKIRKDLVTALRDCQQTLKTAGVEELDALALPEDAKLDPTDNATVEDSVETLKKLMQTFARDHLYDTVISPVLIAHQPSAKADVPTVISRAVRATNTFLRIILQPDTVDSEQVTNKAYELTIDRVHDQATAAKALKALASVASVDKNVKSNVDDIEKVTTALGVTLEQLPPETVISPDQFAENVIKLEAGPLQNAYLKGVAQKSALLAMQEKDRATLYTDLSAAPAVDLTAYNRAKVALDDALDVAKHARAQSYTKEAGTWKLQADADTKYAVGDAKKPIWDKLKIAINSKPDANFEHDAEEAVKELVNEATAELNHAVSDIKDPLIKQELEAVSIKSHNGLDVTPFATIAANPVWMDFANHDATYESCIAFSNLVLANPTLMDQAIAYVQTRITASRPPEKPRLELLAKNLAFQNAKLAFQPVHAANLQFDLGTVILGDLQADIIADKAAHPNKVHALAALKDLVKLALDYLLDDPNEGKGTPIIRKLVAVHGFATLDERIAEATTAGSAELAKLQQVKTEYTNDAVDFIVKAYANNGLDTLHMELSKPAVKNAITVTAVSPNEVFTVNLTNITAASQHLVATHQAYLDYLLRKEPAGPNRIPTVINALSAGSRTKAFDKLFAAIYPQD
jgi:hypothetical protein